LDEPAPLLATDDAPIPEGAEAAWFAGADGAKLRAALIPAKGAPRGSVVLSGGRTEPIEKYFEVIGELTARGFAVLAHDWRGQGLSQRLLRDPVRGHAKHHDDFVADFAAMLGAYEARLPKPWLAVGHSMGGCLTALVLAGGERRFSAAALSAPMFQIWARPVNPTLGKLISSFMKGVGGAGVMTGPIGPPSSFEENYLTHDPRRYGRNVSQVLAHPEIALGPPTWGWLDFAFKAIAELHNGSGVPRVTIPVTVVAAGDDQLVDNRGTRLVTGRFPQGRYVEVPGAFHEILQETDDVRAVFWEEFDALAAAVAQ